ncbi:MAG TPA: DUF1287 domain-containing protein [Kofleriaceae bacterium]|nr:DUF1287 domain-containing protein [Kofleriaceae bacterium]
MRSRFVHAAPRLAILAMIFAGCTARSDAGPAPPAARAAPPTSPHAAPEACLGVADRGIWADLDDRIQLALPAGLTADRVSARLDAAHHVLVLAIDGVPRKPYPLAGPATLTVGDHALALRPGDRDELAPLLTAARLTTGRAAQDRDDDGIPDPLDVLIGGKKTVLNADAYTAEAEQYITLRYPMGDVPRTIGVCTDVIVRAVRNAGIDIQKELHDDIRRARAAYPMVKGGGDPSIDQRRVGTLLPYFQRHWERHTARLDDPADPLRPGDIILMDTFPSRPGPDHIGILSDRVDAQGLPLVINNWTDGTVTAEMDLLPVVPVLYRFRLPA